MSEKNYSPIAKIFSFQIENKYEDEAKVIALFAGTIDCRALAIDAATGKPVFCDADPSGVATVFKGVCDAVMTDGVLPEVKNGVLTMPDTKSGADFLRVTPNDPRFNIKNLKKWLGSNGLCINKITIKSKTQDQFDNPMTFATSSPTDDKGSMTLSLTDYSTPEMLQSNKIVIDDIRGTVLQDDAVILWRVNAGEVINVTMHFSELQQS